MARPVDNDTPCSICGWHCKRVWRFSNNDCDAKRGAAAKEMITLLATHPTITSGIGYGYGRIGIEIYEPNTDPIADGLKWATFVVAFNHEGEVSIDDIYWWRDESPTNVAALIKQIQATLAGKADPAELMRAKLAAMTDDERIAAIAELMAGYCKRCGEALGNRAQCYCWRDE